MKTPAEWKTLFESSAFARQTSYSGPLGPEYNPSGTRLRLWAPTAQKVSVNLYRRGDGGACMGTLPLEQHGQGVWSVYLPGDQHGHLLYLLPSRWTAQHTRRATPTPGRQASTACGA